jgi:tetratricopeptide (TPR) repeat protein
MAGLFFLAYTHAMSTETPIKQMYTKAAALYAAGQWQSAKEIYESILLDQPEQARAVTGLARCLTNLGQSKRALEEARRAVELDPNDLLCINELAMRLLTAGRVDEALDWAKRATAMGPEGARSNLLVASCYEKLHRIDEALEAIRLARAASPRDQNFKFQEARLLARDDDYQKARDMYLEIIQVSGLHPDLRRQIFSELGRVLDKLESYDQAFEASTQSGIEASRTPNFQRFKLESRPRMINAFVKGLTRERLSRFEPEDVKDDSWTPAFLVGFPRSGTTMTEQILAAHSGIVTTDEQAYVATVRNEWARIVNSNPDVGLAADQLEAKDILTLRKAYRDLVEADQDTPIGSRMVVDKLPLNIFNIGVINLIFPDAKIIVALRDPRDCCLSCLMQDFALNSSMIHFLTLERTVRFYTQVMGAWLHFRDIITLSHVTVRYEDTVQNLEIEARRLIDHLGLEWEPGILEFHERAAKRAISTPSYAAVTETVHTRAIGRWKNYRRQFAPLLPQLNPFVREFGYDVDD